ncbi:alanine racemase [Nonomuraea sp. MCN248]|uniref:Alanine racemase n=2 Tax=Nonomuraea corallina TaxID=2989783 RepID=A0ABT4SHS2_9ACTN|nr:alanine racemase [Nonomuraea corallina]MDA0636766.1 alanine racemase [Nonomuraea corallina]
MVTEPVRAEALRLAGAGELPAYVYDLPALRAHAARVRAATAGTAELYYAVKANPAAEILRALDPYVDGFEVASGGELAHVREAVPGRPVAFSGPGKTDAELDLALAPPVHRLHVESPGELARLIARDIPADVLLRANPELPGEDTRQAAASPFGMDEDGLAACLPLLAGAPHVRVRGLHTHLTWAQHDAAALAALARRVTDWALPWLGAHLPGLDHPELDLGGGMGVDYRAPDQVFDWRAYAAALPATGARLRIEPGRSLTAYHGWYVTDVLDVKRNHGRDYAVLRGGTHHLRTPVARGHDQPFTVVPRTLTGPALTGPALTGPATLVGQLCTPRDVLARDVPVPGLRPGDLVVFELAGAYAWSLSHHNFLMHPRPRFRYLD